MSRRWESKGGRVSCIVDRDVMLFLLLAPITVPALIVFCLIAIGLDMAGKFDKDRQALLRERFGDPRTLERERPGHVDTPQDRADRRETLNEAMRNE
jgi:hypothetical protein